MDYLNWWRRCLFFIVALFQFVHKNFFCFECMIMRGSPQFWCLFPIFLFPVWPRPSCVPRPTEGHQSVATTVEKGPFGSNHRRVDSNWEWETLQWIGAVAWARWVLVILQCSCLLGRANFWMIVGVGTRSLIKTHTNDSMHPLHTWFEFFFESFCHMKHDEFT